MFFFDCHGLFEKIPNSHYATKLDKKKYIKKILIKKNDNFYDFDLNIVFDETNKTFLSLISNKSSTLYKQLVYSSTLYNYRATNFFNS